VGHGHGAVVQSLYVWAATGHNCDMTKAKKTINYRLADWNNALLISLGLVLVIASVAVTGSGLIQSAGLFGWFFLLCGSVSAIYLYFRRRTEAPPKSSKSRSK
jgi:uncharacterized Tic20 family protein